MPAPDFSLKDLDGRTHRLAEQKGHVVVLNFWSAECPWSARADEIVAELRPGWGDQVVYWSLASNVGEGEAELRGVAAAKGLQPVLRDEDHAVADLYGAVTTPHFFVIDPLGFLRYAGAPDDVTFRQKAPTRGYLAEAVQAALQGEGPEVAETPGYGCAIVRYLV